VLGDDLQESYTVGKASANEVEAGAGHGGSKADCPGFARCGIAALKACVARIGRWSRRPGVARSRGWEDGICTRSWLAALSWCGR